MNKQLDSEEKNYHAGNHSITSLDVFRKIVVDIIEKEARIIVPDIYWNTTDKRAMLHLIPHRNVSFRVSQALNENLTDDMIRTLVKDKSDKVRSCLILLENLPSDVLERLSKDENFMISSIARGRKYFLKISDSGVFTLSSVTG